MEVNYKERREDKSLPFYEVHSWNDSYEEIACFTTIEQLLDYLPFIGRRSKIRIRYHGPIPTLP